MTRPTVYNGKACSLLLLLVFLLNCTTQVSADSLLLRKRKLAWDALSTTTTAATDEAKVVKENNKDGAMMEDLFQWTRFLRQTTDSMPQVVEPAPWPHETSDIPPDPAVRYGALDNGMRYMILPNSFPPGNAYLRLHVDSGSLMEEDHQLGLAHFLEHMLFNGLRNFAAGELIPIMAALGVAFGRHINAYTTFDETVYSLDLPIDALNLGMTVLRDYADGALLLENEIELERGVVLAELQVRDSVQFRLFRQVVQALLPDHLLPKRFPGGTAEVVSTIPRQEFVDFYDGYYTPKRTTFIAVGDFESDDMERLIRQTFSNMTNPAEPLEEPDLGDVPSGTEFRTLVLSDEELQVDEIVILNFKPLHVRPDTVATRLEMFPLNLANTILTRRLNTLSREPGSIILSGSAERTRVVNSFEENSVSVVPTAGNWAQAVSVLEQEFRRMFLYGVTSFELDNLKADVIATYENRVASAASRHSGNLAGALTATINRNTVFSDPQEDLRIVLESLGTMTTESVSKEFADHWDTYDINLVLYSKTSTDPSSDSLHLSNLWFTSQEVEVLPPEEEETLEWSYTDFGVPGSVISDVLQEDLDIRQLILSNNVRVNLKETDFEENTISLVASFGTGALGQPKDKVDLEEFTQYLFGLGGLGQHSQDDLFRIFSGKSVGTSFSVLSDRFLFQGTTTPDDIELQLQLQTAFFIDPGYREEAVQRYRQVIAPRMAAFQNTLSGASAKMNEYLTSSDGRFAVPTEADMLSYEATDAKDWIHPHLTNGYLEVSIIGDFDSDTLIPLILNTLGALPTRQDTIDSANIDRTLDFPETPANQRFTYESKVDRSAALVIWEVPPVTMDIATSRRLAVLASLFSSRVFKRIREELGKAYGPSASSSPSQAFDYGTFTASSDTTAEDSELIGTEMLDMGTELASTGASQDELDQALLPALTDITTSLTSNSYWLCNVMDKSQLQPYRLDWSRSRSQDYASITLGEINDLAEMYLQPDNAIRVELVAVDPDAQGENEGRRHLMQSFSPKPNYGFDLYSQCDGEGGEEYKDEVGEYRNQIVKDTVEVSWDEHVPV